MKRKKAKILTFYYNNYRIDIEIRCEINFCLHRIQYHEICIEMKGKHSKGKRRRFGSFMKRPLLILTFSFK